MVILQHRSNRKPSGGRYKAQTVKRQYMMGSAATLTKLGATKTKTVTGLGNNIKQRTQQANTANVYNPKTKKYTKAKINSIIENPANRNYARRSIMTKGTLIDTTAGKARITSRPGQEGAINAILLE
jgi:small subunit ribosomal protein S8e